jgi:hypothetical protein
LKVLASGVSVIAANGGANHSAVAAVSQVLLQYGLR